MKHVIFLIIAFLATAANALDFEVGLGIAKYPDPPNGQYFQVHTRDDVPYRFDLRTTAWSVGVSDYINTPSWMPATKWRAEYLSMGTARTVAKGTSDVNYDQQSQTCVSQPCALGTFATWSVETKHQGILLAVAPEITALSGKVFTEFGAYFGDPRIRIRIDRYDGTRDYHERRAGLNIGPAIGLGYQHGKFSVVARYIKADAADRKGGVEGDVPPNHEPRVFNVMGRYQF